MNILKFPGPGGSQGRIIISCVLDTEVNKIGPLRRKRVVGWLETFHQIAQEGSE